MVATETPLCDFGREAPDFSLPDPGGRIWTLADCRGDRGTVVMFICNHCPFVKAVIDRLVADTRELLAEGVGCVAVMSNDVKRYPQDAPDKMAEFAAENDFPFPYLYDESQDVARAYGAVCTPDFFGFNASDELQYRGRLDAGRIDPPPADTPRELLNAMREIAQTGRGPKAQLASMGCSIKWRPEH